MTIKNYVQSNCTTPQDLKFVTIVDKWSCLKRIIKAKIETQKGARCRQVVAIRRLSLAEFEYIMYYALIWESKYLLTIFIEPKQKIHPIDNKSFPHLQYHERQFQKAIPLYKYEKKYLQQEEASTLSATSSISFAQTPMRHFNKIMSNRKKEIDAFQG